jgi:hypothetical protein
MLTVTEAARNRLLSKIFDRDAADDQAMRFTRRTGGWRLSLERAAPSDTTVVHQGRVVLLLDELASDRMAALTLGVRQTPNGPRLRLRGTRSA